MDHSTELHQDFPSLGLRICGTVPAVMTCEGLAVHARDLGAFELAVARELAVAGLGNGEVLRFYRKAVGLNRDKFAELVGGAAGLILVAEEMGWVIDKPGWWERLGELAEARIAEEGMVLPEVAFNQL